MQSSVLLDGVVVVRGMGRVRCNVWLPSPFTKDAVRCCLKKLFWGCCTMEVVASWPVEPVGGAMETETRLWRCCPCQTREVLAMTSMMSKMPEEKSLLAEGEREEAAMC